MKRKIIIYLLILSPFIYVNTDYFIKNHQWRSISKNKISIILTFSKDEIKLNNHIIYDENNEKIGYVFMSFYKILIIIKTNGKICYYYKRI